MKYSKCTLGGIGSVNIGPFSKGDIYKGLKVFSELGVYSNKEDAKKVAKTQNDFFKETEQPLIAKVVSYSKKIGDRTVKVDKVVVFYK